MRKKGIVRQTPRRNYKLLNDSMKKDTLYNSQEWHILFASIMMTLLFIGVIGYYLITDPLLTKTLVLVSIAHTLGGRAAGVSLCLMDGLNPLVTIFYNLFLEVLIVCWVYSLFALSINNYLKFRGLKYYARRLERKARKHKEKISNYGWPGVFFFVMLPLPATGPVIGSIIGYLLKLRVWHNFSAAFSGTLIAILVWFLFFDFLEQHLHIIRYVFFGIIAIAIFSYIATIKKSTTRQK